MLVKIELILISLFSLYLRALALIERRGPQFLVEPQNIVSFLNDTGSVITCTAKGTPLPTISWTKLDGSPLVPVPGLRVFRNDGQSSQLVYLPFAANNYRQDVHSASVRCLASNTMGTVESRECHIRASVKQSYEVQVYDDFVIKGNTGILRCHIPSFVREYVWVTNWMTNDGMQIHSNLANSGRFSVFPTGELHIHRVDSVSDSQRQYRCQTKHKLSGEIKLSANSGRLIVTESQSNMPPKIITTSRYIVSIIGETVELACSTQGFPRPEFTWFKINNNNQKLEHISPSILSKVLQFDGSLIIKQVTVEDSAKYVCITNNTMGKDRLDIELLVRAPLSVILTPSHILVADRDSVTFNCSVFGAPIGRVIWKKNAHNIAYNNRIKLLNDRSLHIKQVKREDKGMFQCIASNEFESSQSSAELSLSDDPPHFTYVFGQTEPLRTGYGLSLKCSATGLPLPQIVWTLDGSPISEHSRLRIGDYVTSDGVVNSYVNITSIRTEDGGIYSCIASNDAYSVSHSNRINIFGPAFVRPMPNMTAIAGQTIHVHCPAAGYPIESISWFKRQSGKLPQNHRQKSLTNGTLIIDKIDRPNDEDSYRCVVNASSSSAYSDVYIKVLVAPVINPFSPPPNLREGMRVMLTCSVVEGDAPVLIEFLKDEMPLRPIHDTNIKIDSNNEFSSTLFISKVSYEDSGNYTCIASNLAAKTTYSVQMIVNVPPKWLISPSDSEAIVGQNVIMDCVASGQPRIWWERSEANGEKGITGSQSHSFRTVISNSHMHTLENGSLTIKEISEEDSGVYLCQANNGVGTGLSKVVSLKVHVPAHFKSKFSAQTVKKGQQVLIVCEAYGELPISIIVSKDRMQFDPSLDSRFEIIKNERIDGFSLSLKIVDSDRRDSALFTCSAANSYGKDEYNVQVIVQESPDKPDNVMVSEINSRSAIITWITPYSGNSIIISYQLEYKTTDNSWDSSDKMVQTIPGSDNSFTIRGLKPITTYDIRIRAENKLGFSVYSQSSQFTTTEEAPSGPPLNVQVFPLSARTLQVTFSPPKIESRNGRILGYYVGYKAQDIDEHFMFKKISINEFSNGVNLQKEVKLTELKRSTKYAIIVQSFNSKGPGPQSEEIFGETLVNDPPKAPTLTIVNIGFDSIELNWNIEDNEENLFSDINGYYIYSKNQYSEWDEKQISAQTNSYTFTDLQCGTQYQFYVIAYNTVGKGDPSQAIAVKTKGSVPTAPKQSNTFIVPNTTSAIIKLDSWIINGCDIRYFFIKYKSKYDNEWTIVSNQISPQQKYIELIELSPANWYSLNVMASTDAGNTEQLYNFATLTTSGATVSPLDMTRPFTYHNLTIIIPATCSVIVLTVILIVACFVVNKRRPANNDNSVLHNQQNCRDDQLITDAFHLAVLEPRKENNCSDGNCVDNSSKEVYFQSPYALSRVQRQMCVESDMSSLNSLRHSRHEHVYDIPFPPKWV